MNKNTFKYIFKFLDINYLIHLRVVSKKIKEYIDELTKNQNTNIKSFSFLSYCNQDMIKYLISILPFKFVKILLKNLLEFCIDSEIILNIPQNLYSIIQTRIDDVNDNLSESALGYLKNSGIEFSNHIFINSIINGNLKRMKLCHKLGYSNVHNIEMIGQQIKNINNNFEHLKWIKENNIVIPLYILYQLFDIIDVNNLMWLLDNIGWHEMLFINAINRNDINSMLLLYNNIIVPILHSKIDTKFHNKINLNNTNISTLEWLYVKNVLYVNHLNFGTSINYDIFIWLTKYGFKLDFRSLIINIMCDSINKYKIFKYFLKNYIDLSQDIINKITDRIVQYGDIKLLNIFKKYYPNINLNIKNFINNNGLNLEVLIWIIENQILYKDELFFYINNIEILEHIKINKILFIDCTLIKYLNNFKFNLKFEVIEWYLNNGILYNDNDIINIYNIIIEYGNFNILKLLINNNLPITKQNLSYAKTYNRFNAIVLLESILNK